MKVIVSREDHRIPPTRNLPSRHLVACQSENREMSSENYDFSRGPLKENSPLRMSITSSAEYLEKIKSASHKTQNKKGFENHVTKSSLTGSNSFNDALTNDLTKFKRRPSMIPKSRSVKKAEKGNVEIGSPLQSEEIPVGDKSNKNELTDKAKTEACDPKEFGKEQKRDSFAAEPKTFCPKELKEGSGNLERDASGASMKSCVTEMDFDGHELKTYDWSAASMKSVYKDVEEDLGSYFAFVEEFAEEEKREEERETERQERGIRTLYETLKSTGAAFDDLKWICEKKEEDNTSAKDWQNFSVQKCYDVTLAEISDIWKSTMSLISSVKEHAVKLIEEKEEANSLDKEQLVLESEMVQLAVDVAINYSKLKTDRLIKSVEERLGVENLMKTSLEEFMDSKTFPAMYNEEDLATMSQTIKDLSANVYKKENLTDRVQT